MTDRQVVAANPTNTILWMGVSPGGEGPTIETICPYINFFASNDHAAQWRERNTDQGGVLLDLQEAREFLNEALSEAYCRVGRIEEVQGANQRFSFAENEAP